VALDISLDTNCCAALANPLQSDGLKNRWRLGAIADSVS
jgi:hypothetical protein